MAKHRPVVYFVQAKPTGWYAKIRGTDFSAWGGTKDQAEIEVLKQAQEEGRMTRRGSYRNNR